MTGAIVTSSGEHHRGFHQCPNILRDKYAKLVGVDGYGFINYLLSWANTKTTLSVRRMMADLSVSQSKLERIQQAVLSHCGHFIQVTPGDRTTANGWHIDMEKVWGENAIHMAQSYAERVAALGVLKSDTPQKVKQGRRVKGVLKSDTPGVLKSDTPGVLKSDTYKDKENTHPKDSGVLHVVEDVCVSADAQPSTQPAATIPAPYTTTFEATPETAPELVAPSAPPVAVLSPDGDAAHAALADLALSDQDFDELFQEPVVNQATSLEKVPPAAPPAVKAPSRPEMAPTRPSMDALAPIPQDELLSRPPAVSGDEPYRLIRAMVGGEGKLADLLLQPTPTGGIDRERWLRLTHTEVSAVKAAAQAGAQAGEGGMMTLVIRGLDRLIGAGDGKAGGKAEVVALPGAYVTKEEREAQRAALATLPAIADGSTWRSRKSGKVLTVDEVRDGAVFFTDGSELMVPLFHRTFERVGITDV